jgi:hypothetical protein
MEFYNKIWIWIWKCQWLDYVASSGRVIDELESICKETMNNEWKSIWREAVMA